MAKHRGAVRSGPFGSQLHHEEFVESGIAAVGIRDVQVNRFALQCGWYVTPEKFKELERYRIFPNDVLATIVGSIGRFCVVPPNVPLAFTTKHVLAMTLDPNRANAHFVSFMLNFHERCRASLFRQVEGSAQQTLNSGKVLRSSIPVPALVEQRRIVAHLRRLEDSLITLTQRHTEVSAELDAMLPSVLDKAFRGEL